MRSQGLAKYKQNEYLDGRNFASRLSNEDLNFVSSNSSDMNYQQPRGINSALSFKNSDQIRIEQLDSSTVISSPKDFRKYFTTTVPEALLQKYKINNLG